jgi:hypothetical protein
MIFIASWLILGIIHFVFCMYYDGNRMTAPEQLLIFFLSICFGAIIFPIALYLKLTGWSL